jgi:hypothetical protein
MKSSHRTASKIVALLIVFALFDLSLPASFASSNAALPSVQLVGKLSTQGNRSILVNGNNTDAGATILDGAVIVTPDGTGATIDLGPLGEIELDPNTEAVINFSDGMIKVTLRRGCARVKRREDAEGSIILPDGSVVPTDKDDKNKRKRGAACAPVLGGTTPAVDPGAAGGGGGGGGGGIGAATVGAFIAGISAVVVAVIVGLNADEEGDNQSPGSPNRAL